MRGYLLGLGAITLGVAAINTLNVISAMHDVPGMDIAEPLLWEGSSWFTLTLFAIIPWAALQLAPLSSRPRWRLALVHVPALALFAVCHIGGFLLIRQAVYAAAGHHYGGSFAADFPYEVQKDAIAYPLAVFAFWLAGRWIGQRTALASTAFETMFDIRDGARLTRVKLTEILAITSAGNYVEFVLEDGRRPLMRSSLAAVEEELTPRGFVRIHRSWLVNEGRVTGLVPEGSGDYAVTLGALTAPLSRRFPDALARLRGG